MKIAFVVNEVATEVASYTTTRLAKAAGSAGHDVYYIGTDDFIFDADEAVAAHATRAPEPKGSLKEYLERVKSTAARKVDLAQLDVVMLRNDPADDFLERPYRQSAGIVFGELAAGRGTLVLNDPLGLSQALNKLYFHAFPPEVRPRTLVTRDSNQIKDFIEEQGGRAILKPLQGSGGQSVFMVNKGDAPNLSQMIDAVARDGYVVAQEYLPAAAEGDVRLFMLNGSPLEKDGKYAVFARRNTGSDVRSNMAAGGTMATAEITAPMRRIAEIVGPKLIKDGMFFVGLDIAGDKLMEINVFSPGGLGTVKKLLRVDFCPVVIEALERKAEYRRVYGHFTNSELASM